MTKKRLVALSPTEFSHFARTTQPILLGDYLTNRFSFLDRQQWLEQIGNGRILVAGSPASVLTLIRSGEQIVYRPAPWVEPPVNRDYAVLYQDTYLLAVNKPAPLPVHPQHRYQDHTLLNILRSDFDREVFPLHRLDLETTGVCLFAFDATTARELGLAWRQHLVVKTYCAWVTGMVSQTRGELCGKIDRLPGKNQYHLTATGKTAITYWRRGPGNGKETLLYLRPLTGRPHQIRLQLHAAGMGIVGDKRYNHFPDTMDRFIAEGYTPELEYRLGAARQLLHCYRIRLPATRNIPAIALTAPLPADMRMRL